MKWLLALCALSLLLTLTTPVARAGDLTPPAPVTPATTVYNINAGAGGQTDPHISGTLVSYSDNSSYRIAYYDLASGQSGAISHPDGFYDNLSDVSEGKIVFTRFTSVYQNIYAFDVNSPGAVPYLVPANTASISRRMPSIGHGTIAWEELYGTGQVPEIGLYDPVGGRAIRLTNDDQPDAYPAVSADGSMVVWVKCASGTGCHIYQATRGGNWTPVQLTGGTGQPAGTEALPDTNGQIVVYYCVRNGEADICWQPVGGGAETRLLMPGVQRGARISGDLISFESSPAALAPIDLYVYDLSTEILYKLTDTTVSESLGGLSIGADGKVYVTWAQPKQAYPYDMDVYALSFTRLPRSSFTVHALFDQAHSYKLGGVVPVRLQLWDAQGINISSPTLILNATGVVQRGGSSAPLVVESPGNANPSNNFRYDATLPGYIYNLSTKNLAVGTWELQFNVSGSSAPYAITFDLR